jgi:hypothetical protein
MPGLYPANQILAPTTNNMTGTSSLTSTPMNWDTIRGGSIQAVWTGSPVGSFVIQGSLNYSQNPNGSANNPGTWNTVPSGTFLGTLTAPAGSAGSALVDCQFTGIPWIRVVYTNSSGTGTLTLYGAGKGN